VTFADSDEVTGRIGGSDQSGADVDVDGTLRRVEYADVATARIQIEFKREA